MKFINIQTDKFKKYDLLPVEDKACLLDCIVSYARDGVEPPDGVSVVVEVMFSQIQDDMVYYEHKYSKRCEVNRKVGKMGGRPRKEKPKETDGLLKETDGLLEKPKDKEKREKGKDKKKDKSLLIDKTKSFPDSFSDDAQMDRAIKNWMAYKKERGQTYKPIGLKAFVTRLHNLSGGRGDVALQIVEQSISNNYSGVFPLKDIQAKNNSEVGVVLQDTKNKDYTKGGW